MYCVYIYYTLFIFNLSYCLYACNNFLHVNFMLLINKHTKEDFFYVPSTANYMTHPRHKLAQASKFHLLVTFLNFLKLIHVLIPLPPCWLHLKHFYACLPLTFNFFLQTSKSSPTLHYYTSTGMLSCTIVWCPYDGLSLSHALIPDRASYDTQIINYVSQII